MYLQTAEVNIDYTVILHIFYPQSPSNGSLLAFKDYVNFAETFPPHLLAGIHQLLGLILNTQKINLIIQAFRNSITLQYSTDMYK